MLERITKPEQVKQLNFEELSVLAAEVRERIIEVTSINGGHVASSLGATDFIIALLKVFDPLVDQIVFDVGHQTYAYKILTERNNHFDTLRTFGGISGFPNIFESPFDAFSVGHASTSISAALGITVSKALQGIHGQVIAVLGDGALTGGLAFEALNHAGHLQKDLIVILNDNKMSISRNVGALHRYMSNVLTSKSYNVVKNQIWDKTQRLSDKYKKPIIYGARKIEESIMNVFVPNIIFEDLGFKYIGPIDGHDIPYLCKIFMSVKENLRGPVFIHLVTKKGKGLAYAENNALKFHGIASYSYLTGETDAVHGASWSTVFGEKINALAEQDNKIVAITAAMADGTGLSKYSEKYEERFFDVGIAEAHAVTLAAGLAIKGLKPFVAVYSTFLQRAFDQILHDVALQKLPVIFCIDRAGIVGEDGATHHGVFDLSYLQLVPGLVIIAPAFAEELEQAMEWASLYSEGPVVLRYPRGFAPLKKASTMALPNTFSISLGVGEVWREGNFIAISGVGHSFSIACELFTMIHAKYPDLSIQLINPLFIKPYDRVVYDKVYSKCKYHLVIEENSQIGGFASRLCLDYHLSDCKTIPFGIPDIFLSHGKTELLREQIALSGELIFAKIGNILESNPEI